MENDSEPQFYHLVTFFFFFVMWICVIVRDWRWIWGARRRHREPIWRTLGSPETERLPPGRKQWRRWRRRHVPAPLLPWQIWKGWIWILKIHSKSLGIPFSRPWWIKQQHLSHFQTHVLSLPGRPPLSRSIPLPSKP